MTSPSIRVLHTADWHYCSKYLTEADRCVQTIIAAADSEDVDVAVIAGDLVDQSLTIHSEAFHALCTRIRELANVVPVLVIQGTQSHDVPGSLEALKHLRATFPVHVMDRIGQCWYQPTERDFLALDEATDGVLFACLPAVNRARVVAATLASENGDELTAREAVQLLLQQWAGEWAHRSVPRLIVSHGTVTGAITEHGVPMAGLDHEFDLGTLGQSGATGVLLGHIHKPQFYDAPHQVRVAYAGSPGRYHYGEEGEKGFWIWDCPRDGGSPTLHWHTTPARQLIHLDFDGPPDVEQVRAAVAADPEAHVRVRWQVDEEHRQSVDETALRDALASSAGYQLEGRVNPVVRQRAAGISATRDLSEQVRRWAETVETAPEPLLERLSSLEAVHNNDEADSLSERIIRELEGA